MSTITRERLEQLANFRGAPVTRQEEQELARIALESHGAKKIILYRERNPYNGLTTGWEELTEQEYEIVKDNASKHAEFRTVYTAPPAPVVPAELHPDTQKLVIDFCTALAEKLYKAQLKYGYDADWKQDGWPTQCQAHFHQHIAKGDPRDVAAYCAFMWYHGWKTEPAPVSVHEAAPVAYIFKHPAGRLFWSLTDESNKGQSDVMPVYSAPVSAFVPPAIEPDYEVIKGILPTANPDEYACCIAADMWNACRDAMLQGAEPVTTAYKLPPHIYRELVNRLRDTAVKYQGCQQLREQLSRTLQEVIQPAAPQQEEKAKPKK